jgi:feruloyl esterase
MSGQKLVIGGPQPGSEQAWAGAFVPHSTQEPNPSAIFASDVLRGLAFWQPLAPGWDIYKFQFTAETLQGLMPMHGLYDATDPDLSAFAKRGGKLLMWHGWSDPLISPLNSIAYVQAVEDQIGADASRNILRLFLIPGMYHCGAGDGMTSVDVLSPLTAWVETSKAPDSIIASRNDADAATGRGRVVFAYPATSALASGADPDHPASWHAGPPISVPAKLYSNWAGASLFKPGYEQECGFQAQTFTCHPRH